MNKATESQKSLRVFLCHSSEDKPRIIGLYRRLRTTNGVDPWIDEENLLPGQNWRQEIPKAVKNSDVVIVCLSQATINKRGYVQREIKYALDIADEQPEGAIFIIPLRLEECDIPDRLADLHCVDYFKDDGYIRLIRALQKRASELGLTVAHIDNWIMLLELGTSRNLNEVIRSPQFLDQYPDTLSPEQFVDKISTDLNRNLPPVIKEGLVAAIEARLKTRAQVLREILERHG